MTIETKDQGKRRGFLKTLGFGTAAAVTPALAPQVLAQRADHVPASAARKEDRNARTAARYQAGAADVQAFYRTNRYEN